MCQHDMMKTKGRSLTLFYINGQPDGIVTAEVFNWTGHVLTIPRMQLITEGLARKEASHTAVYLLCGEDEEGSFGYIGESEDVKKRIKDHEVSKDWWTYVTRVVIITTATNNLNTAHVKYLEAQLIKIANCVDRVNLKNSNEPKPPSLSEVDRANMESFLENVLLVLPALGVDWFVDDTRSSCPGPDSPTPAPDAPAGGSGAGANPTFVLQLPKDDVRTPARHAIARIEDGKFVVQKGSPARFKWVGAKHHSYTDLFKRLCNREILEEAEDKSHRVFTKNCAFDSTSAAGSVVSGYPRNGPQSWKTKDGKTYAEWEKERLQSEDPESEETETEESESQKPEAEKPKSKKSEAKKPRPKKPKAKK